MAKELQPAEKNSNHASNSRLNMRRRSSSLRDIQSAIFVHPLLGYHHIPIHSQGLVSTYENKLQTSDEEQQWLRQFMVRNQPFLNTGAFVEMLMAAGALQNDCRFGAQTPVLDAVFMLADAPMANSPAIFQTIVAHTPGESSHFLVINSRWDSGNGYDEYLKCASALCRIDSGASRPVMGGGIHLGELYDRCEEHFEAADVYRQFEQQLELRYGPMCRPLHWLRVGRSEALAKIVCTNSGTSDYFVHPNDLEGIVQATMGRKVAEESVNTSLKGVSPFSYIARVQYSRVAADSVLYTHVTQQTDKSTSATIFDETGSYLGRLTDVSLTLEGPVTMTMTASANLNEHLYVLIWENVELSREATSDERANWLVVCQRETVKNLTRRLSDSRIALTFLFLEDGYFSSPWLAKRFRRLDDIGKYVDLLFRTVQPLHGILHLNQQILSSGDDFTAQCFTRIYQRSWLIHQWLFKTLATKQKVPMAFWVVNRQNLFSAPFLGMAITLLADFPVFRTRNLSVDSLGALQQEMLCHSLAKDDHARVQYGENRRYVHSVQPMVEAAKTYFYGPETRYTLVHEQANSFHYHPVEHSPKPTRLRGDEVEVLIRHLAMSQGEVVGLAGHVFRYNREETVREFGDSVYGPNAIEATHQVCRENEVELIPRKLLMAEASAMPMAHIESVFWMDRVLALERFQDCVIETKMAGCQLAIMQKLWQHGAVSENTAGGLATITLGSSNSSHQVVIEMQKHQIFIRNSGHVFNNQETVLINDAPRPNSNTSLQMQLLNREIAESLFEALPFVITPLHDINNAIVDSMARPTVIHFWPPVIDLISIPDDAESMGIGILSGVGSGLFDLMFKFLYPMFPLFIIADTSYTTTAKEGVDVDAQVLSMADSVRLAVVDLGNRAELEPLFQQIRTFCTIISIVHSAPCSNEFPSSQELSFGRLEEGLRRNVLAAWCLHRLSLQFPVGQFIVIAGLSSAVGLKGHANSDAAYAFLAQLSNYRSQLGLPSSCVHLGPWDIAVGLETPPTETLGAMHETDGLLALELAMTHDFSQFLIAKVARQASRTWLRHPAMTVSPIVDLAPVHQQQIQLSKVTVRQERLLNELVTRLIATFGPSAASYTTNVFQTNLHICNEVLEVYRTAVKKCTGSDSLIPKNALARFLSLESLTRFVLKYLRQKDLVEVESDSLHFPIANRQSAGRLNYSQIGLLQKSLLDFVIRIEDEVSPWRETTVKIILYSIIQKQTCLRTAIDIRKLQSNILSFTEAYIPIYSRLNHQTDANGKTEGKNDLIQIKLCQHSAHEALIVQVHPLLMDVWSQNLFINEFVSTFVSEFLTSPSVTPTERLLVHSADYAEWELQHLQAQAENTSQHWADISYSYHDFLPVDRILLEPSPQSDYSTIEYKVPANTGHKLEEYCSRHNVNPQAVLLAVFGALHKVISGNDCCTVGLASNTRDHLPSLMEPVIGQFPGVIPFELETADNPTGFHEIVARLDTELDALLKFKTIPLSYLTETFPHLQKLTELQTTIVMDELPFVFDFTNEQLNVTTSGTAYTDVVWTCAEFSATNRGQIMYKTAMFSTGKMKRYLQQFYQLLPQLLEPSADWDDCIERRQLSFEAGNSRTQLHEVGKQDYPRNQTLDKIWQDHNRLLCFDLTGWHTFDQLKRNVAISKMKNIERYGTAINCLAVRGRIDNFNDITSVLMTDELMTNSIFPELISLTDNLQISHHSTISAAVPYSAYLALLNNAKITLFNTDNITTHVACDSIVFQQHKGKQRTSRNIERMLLLADPKILTSPSVQQYSTTQVTVENSTIVRNTIHYPRRLNGNKIELEAVLSALSEACGTEISHIISLDGEAVVAVVNSQQRMKSTSTSSKELQNRARRNGIPMELIPDFFVELRLLPNSLAMGRVDYDAMRKALCC